MFYSVVYSLPGVYSFIKLNANIYSMSCKNQIFILQPIIFCLLILDTRIFVVTLSSGHVSNGILNINWVGKSDFVVLPFPIQMYQLCNILAVS